MSDTIEKLCPSRMAGVLVESFINGNRTWVREELDAWPQEFSLAVVAHMMEAFTCNPRERASFLRLLDDSL